MATVYGICAVLGGTVLLCQFVMALIGLSGDHDLSNVDGDMDFDAHGGASHGHSGHHGQSTQDGHHHGSTWFFGVITFRTVVAALAFFGLTGLAARSSGVGGSQTLLVALAAGVGAMFVVHWLMQQMSRLHADCTVRIDAAVGATGTVYLKVPGHNRGAGKVQLNLRNRTVEIEAMTAGDEIPTGAQVVVLGVAGPDLVEVGRAPAPSEVSHV
jgi:hypothetical protein